MNYEFIDKNEILDYFSDEFDFDLFDNSDWDELDRMVEEECENRGVEPSMENEEYIEICRDCIDELMEGR